MNGIGMRPIDRGGRRPTRPGGEQPIREFLPMLRSDKISRMELTVLFSEDPAFVLRRADKFLSSEPVLHNLILSILHSRVAQRDPGRYWIALEGEETVGVVVQSPLEYPAT